VYFNGGLPTTDVIYPKKIKRCCLNVQIWKEIFMDKVFKNLPGKAEKTHEIYQSDPQPKFQQIFY
jgi:hypothetical protein